MERRQFWTRVGPLAQTVFRPGTTCIKEVGMMLRQHCMDFETETILTFWGDGTKWIKVVLIHRRQIHTRTPGINRLKLLIQLALMPIDERMTTPRVKSTFCRQRVVMRP